MATLHEIREAMRAAISTGIGANSAFVYDSVPDVSETPAIVVMPAAVDTADFTGAMQRGLDTWQIDVVVMVSRMDYETSQDSLDSFLTGSGAVSIRRAIYENPTLGLNDGTDAFASGIRGYGGKFEQASVDHIGAILRVTVRTQGT